MKYEASEKINKSFGRENLSIDMQNTTHGHDTQIMCNGSSRAYDWGINKEQNQLYGGQVLVKDGELHAYKSPTTGGKFWAVEALPSFPAREREIVRDLARIIRNQA